MSRFFKKSVIFAFLGVFSLGMASAQQDPPAVDQHRTGLIPLDAKQLREVLTTWPRVDRVNLNRLGLERVNEARALKGLPPLSPNLAKPIGQEVESSIHRLLTLSEPQDLNDELLGDLPAYVDNSALPHFPPIRSQGAQGSCASFSSTYYQLSHMTALQRGLDITDPDDNTNKYSPKWSYNMLNEGADTGTSLTENLLLLAKHGACTWAEFPYDDTEYLAWCLDASAWRNALYVRTRHPQFSWHTETDAGLEVIKQLLANGYVLTFGTYIYSWQFTTVEDDPSTIDDNAAVGKNICYYMNGTSGGHGMTIVGYNDAVWTDINNNDVIDPGEKGALRIANSWGTTWNPTDGGFTWLAYDALKDPSAVEGGPSAGRVPALDNNVAYVLTARDGYAPMLVAEFTVNHARRNQMIMRLGHSDTSVELPTTLWTPLALAQQGGAYAFDGSTTAVDGTFVLDYTDILPPVGVMRRLYLGMSDSTFGDPGILSAFKLIDTTTNPDTETVAVIDPALSVDGSTEYVYVDYMYNGPTYNSAPSIYNGQVIPAVGTTTDSYLFAVWYYDVDGQAPTIKDVYIDGNPYPMTYFSGSGSVSTSNGWYTYETGLGGGTHNFRYYFEDTQGAWSTEPVTAAPPPYSTYAGPVVAVDHNVSVPNTPSGDTTLDSGQSSTFTTGGSICELGHDVQYQFDWGDGTYSGWLAVGVTSASHAWIGTGSHAVRAQARCAVDTVVVSSWSSALTVNVTGSVLLAEDFMDATGWLQQTSGFSATLWYLSDSSFAGGTPYEVRCQWYNINPGTTRLITPALDTTGLSSLRLSFKHFLDTYGPGCTLKIQTSPDKSVWTDEAWSVASTSVNLGPETIETTLAHNLGIATTYVAFVITGNLYQYDFWYIDDVVIQLATAPKVDFNGDGQEDILWRYYGGGAYQGLNLAWLMGQTGTAAPMTLTAAASEAGARSSIYDETLIPASQIVQRVEIPRSSDGSPKDPFKTVLLEEKARVPKTRMNSKNPMDLAGDLSKKVRGRGIGREIAGFLGVEDAPLPGATDSGEVDLSSLALGTEVVISVLPDTTWEIAGTADFNGDGKTDILWRNYGTGAFQGMNDIWFMNGTTFVSETIFSIVADTSWRIAGTGDFNGDGKTDILWRNHGSGAVQGMNVIWFMDNGVFQSETVFSQIPDTSWRIAGTGDFNGDGKTDILWRYHGAGAYQGMNVVWFMDGPAFQSESVFSIISDTAWEIAGTGDFDSDGKTDILWRYYGVGAYQGMNDIWYLNGTAFLKEEIFSVIPDTNWRIVNR